MIRKHPRAVILAGGTAIAAAGYVYEGFKSGDFATPIDMVNNTWDFIKNIMPGGDNGSDSAEPPSDPQEPPAEAPEPPSTTEPTPSAPEPSEPSPTPEPGGTPEPSIEPPPSPEPSEAPESLPEPSPEPEPPESPGDNGVHETPDGRPSDQPSADTPEHDDNGLGEAPDEEAPETPQHEGFTEEQLTIKEGMGWYEKFDELNIESEHQVEFLNEIGPELEDRGLAYWDEQHNEWRMNYNDGGISHDDLEWIQNEARDQGFLPETPPESETEPKDYIETEPADKYTGEIDPETGRVPETPWGDAIEAAANEANFDPTAYEQNPEYRQAEYNFIDRVLRDNNRTWAGSWADYHPGDSLKIYDDTLNDFLDKVEDITGEDLNRDTDQPTEPDQPEIPDEIGEGELQDIITERLDASVSDLSDEQLQSLWAGTGAPPPESLSSSDINSLNDLSEYAPRDDQGNIHPQFIENLLDLLPDEPEAYDNGTVYPWQLWVATAAILTGGVGLAAWGGGSAYKKIRRRRAARGTPPAATGSRNRPGRNRSPSAPRGRTSGRHRTPTGRRGAPVGP